VVPRQDCYGGANQLSDGNANPGGLVQSPAPSACKHPDVTAPDSSRFAAETKESCSVPKILLYVEVLGRHASLKRLDLGCHDNVQQAKRVCELHCAAGCDLSNAKKITH
jgi:hypothetical protein